MGWIYGYVNILQLLFTAFGPTPIVGTSATTAAVVFSEHDTASVGHLEP
jgi:hypothetical protein